jgi:hypothetical protein
MLANVAVIREAAAMGFDIDELLEGLAGEERAWAAPARAR